MTVTLPDGRQVLLEHEGPAGNWVARLAGGGPAVAQRQLLAALGELLDLPRGPKPAWALDLKREILGRDTSDGRRYACPCCDYFTLSDPPTDTYAICRVCGWEDDPVQFNDLDQHGGANKVSLREARANFHRHGVSDPARRGRARPPRPEERP